jgi:lysozyme
MDYEEIKTRIKKHEGFIPRIYKDILGKATIGYGHLVTEKDNFQEGVEYSKEELEEVFNQDFNKAVEGANELTSQLSLVLATVKGVIIEMVFQLGKTGVSKFKKFFVALEKKDYNEAANQMIDSNWHKQTPKRCEELANIIRSCV